MNLLLLAMTYFSGLATMGVGLYVAFMPFGDGFAASMILTMGICVMVIGVFCTKDAFGAFSHPVTVKTRVHSVAQSDESAPAPVRNSTRHVEKGPRPVAPGATGSRRQSPTPRPKQRGTVTA